MSKHDFNAIFLAITIPKDHVSRPVLHPFLQIIGKENAYKPKTIKRQILNIS